MRENKNARVSHHFLLGGIGLRLGVAERRAVAAAARLLGGARGFRDGSRSLGRGSRVPPPAPPRSRHAPGAARHFRARGSLGPPPAATPLTRSLEPAFDMAPPRAARASRPRAFPGLALALALLFASAAVSEAYYYGRYGGYGGVTVVRRTTRVRRPRGYYGRRLAQADDAVAEPPLASAPAPAPAGDDGGDDDDDASECDTILDIVRTRPELSQLAEALSDLPRLRRALDRVDRDGDTFFAPTNAAIDALLAWGGFVEKAEVRRPSASDVARRPGPDDDSRTPRRRHQLSDAAPKSREDFFSR